MCIFVYFCQSLCQLTEMVEVVLVVEILGDPRILCCTRVPIFLSDLMQHLSNYFCRFFILHVEEEGGLENG